MEVTVALRANNMSGEEGQEASVYFVPKISNKLRASGDNSEIEVLNHPTSTMFPPTLKTMRLGLSEALPSLVKAKFNAAKANSSLLFSPSELSIIRTSTDIPVRVPHQRRLYTLRSHTQYQLRFCPSLAKKPIPKQPDATPKQKVDPFENPPPDLHIVDIPTTNPTHLLVLNKFPIIKEHFILATLKNKKQTHFLEQDDLEATYACLREWQVASGGKKRLFAFFNSGDHSGASQPHRHIQFLPVEGMRDRDASNDWQLLIDSILDTNKVFATGDLQSYVDVC
jgi:ATP adenylyltransferase